MILGMEIGLAIYGLLAIFTGKVFISKTKMVYGTPARLLGLFALTPLPLSFGAILLYASSQAPADPQRFAADNQITIMLIEAGVVIGIAVLGYVISCAIAVNPQEIADPDEETDEDRDEPGRDRDANRRPWDR